MKLFYFNPNGYGTEWFVMAEDREAAIFAVKRHLRAASNAMSWSESQAERDKEFQGRLRELDCYIHETPNQWEDKPPCIQEFGPGEVVETEIC